MKLALDTIRVQECELGRGLFAERPITAGEEIFRWDGAVQDLHDIVRRGPRDEANAIQIGPRTYIYPEGAGLFINHSCTPNTGLREDVIQVALRDIEPGEELRFDYSTSLSEARWTMDCQCGARLCRGRVGDFHELPAPLQHDYIGMGIVQRFIVREFFQRQTSLPADNIHRENIARLAEAARRLGYRVG
jgi:uncharacterized protein